MGIHPYLDKLEEEAKDQASKVSSFDKPEAEVHDMSHLNQMLKDCKHRYFRKDAMSIECVDCPNGWIDLGRFTISDYIITHLDNNPI